MQREDQKQYVSPLGSRYASAAMSYLFSDFHRAKLWRRIWIYLADEQRKLGLPISKLQVKSLEKNIDRIDLAKVREIENRLKHDVMSHLKAYAMVAKPAEPILHLGATSAFVTDNAEALLLKEAVELLQRKILVILKKLESSILKFASLEMTGFTHFQPAQPVTLGKRLGLWAQDLLWDYEELQIVLDRYVPLGCKGTTGTQASFMILFKNNYKKVEALDRAVCKRMGFERPVALSGQTLSRKLDVWFLNALANFGATASKLSYDMRLLQHTGEVREPFAAEQVGSSAMPYKQNPMLAERISGLSRFLMSLAHNATWTHGVQWLERSLDDSSNRRLTIPEAFLTADSVCDSLYRLVAGFRVDEKLIARNLSKYRPMFETEAAMMEGTLKGESRQELHERIRQQSVSGKLEARVSEWKLSGAAGLQATDFVKKTLRPFITKEAKKFGVSLSDEGLFKKQSV